MSQSFEAGEDNGLAPEEKQVSFVSCKDEPFFRVHSEVAAVTRRLLAHSEFAEEKRRVQDGRVVSVTGRIPRTCLTVKSSPKSTEDWSGLISGGVFDD